MLESLQCLERTQGFHRPVQQYPHPIVATGSGSACRLRAIQGTHHERLEVIGAGLGGMQTMISFKKAGRKVASSVFPRPLTKLPTSPALRT